MTTRKYDSEETVYRRQLAPLANALVRASPQRLRESTDAIRMTALPINLRILAELLVARLDYKNQRVQAGAAEALVALGPVVLPTLKSAVLKKPSEVFLLRLAPVLVVLGRQLPEGERGALQVIAGIAAGQAPTLNSRVVMYKVMSELRDP